MLLCCGCTTKSTTKKLLSEWLLKAKVAQENKNGALDFKQNQGFCRNWRGSNGFLWGVLLKIMH